MESFPPNSKKAKAREREPVQRVTSTTAVRRKKPLGKQFSQTFFGGDARTAWNYSITNVMIPMIQDTIIEMVQSGVERLIRGDHRPRRTGYLGHVNYRGMYGSGPQQRVQDDRPPLPRTITRPGRARQVFDEIIIPSRQEAEEVIDRLYDLISKYESATVADLYELTGLESNHVDHTWGWTSLRGATVTRARRGGGYLLDLPEPEYLQ